MRNQPLTILLVSCFPLNIFGIFFFFVFQKSDYNRSCCGSLYSSYLCFFELLGPVDWHFSYNFGSFCSFLQIYFLLLSLSFRLFIIQKSIYLVLFNRSLVFFFSFFPPFFYGLQTFYQSVFKFTGSGTSLVAQWLRICLPVQGTWVRSLVREDPTYRRATKPVHHNYWACALDPVSHNYWALLPQLLKPAHLDRKSVV